MIRHICMFKLKEENREENLAEALRRAESLRQIPHIRRFEVAFNAKEAPESNFELTLIFDFDSIDDLNAYQLDERHAAFGRYIGQIRTARACIDYEI